MVGGTLLEMEMICTQLAEFVQSSVTVCVRRISPPQLLPMNGPSVQVYVRLVSQLSLALPPAAMN